MEIRAVELFCGIGGFRIACDSLGIHTIWANDNSSKACSVYRDNFGKEALAEGDIEKEISNVPEHDLLTAGFPCQPFSSAGQKKGIKDPRGTLFINIIEVLKSRKPKYFVLENVKRLLSMKKGSQFAAILNELAKLDYFIEWRLLNAVHFGLPQNRQRVFITGIRKDLIQKIPTIKLATTSDLDCLSEYQMDSLMHTDDWNDIEKRGNKFSFWGVAYKNKYFAANLSMFSDAIEMKPLKSLLEEKSDPRYDFTESTIERIERSEYVNRFYEGVQILYNQGGGARMGYTVFGIEGIAPTLTATQSRHYERYKIDDRFRRLTNVEYARLQGFQDMHCKSISPYDQYALYGNAVPPPMTKWTIKKLIFSESSKINKPKC